MQTTLGFWTSEFLLTWTGNNTLNLMKLLQRPSKYGVLSVWCTTVTHLTAPRNMTWWRGTQGLRGQYTNANQQRGRWTRARAGRSSTWLTEPTTVPQGSDLGIPTSNNTTTKSGLQRLSKETNSTPKACEQQMHLSEGSTAPSLPTTLSAYNRYTHLEGAN